MMAKSAQVSFRPQILLSLNKNVSTHLYTENFNRFAILTKFVDQLHSLYTQA